MANREISSIGEMKNGEYHLRGTPITTLIGEADFICAMWLAWTGFAPEEKTKRLLAACLVAAVDHGAAPPSAAVARIVASCGKPLADAVAAGLLTLGSRHGNAASAASAWLSECLLRGESPDVIAQRAIESKQRLAGLGHPEYDVDPRAVKLFEIAKTTLSATRHIDLILRVSACLSELKEKPLPVNVDGAIGAIVADLGIPSDLADAIFITARTVGLLAHARDEMGRSASYRRG